MQDYTAPNGQTIRIIDSNNPNVPVPPTLINSYSILTIPAYYRAMKFISNNLAAFPRKVHKDAADVPHALDTLLTGKPNPYQNAFVFWRTLFLAAAHHNDGFARVDRAAARPVALHNLREGDVMPFRYDDGSGMRQYYYLASTKEILFGEDVIHLNVFGLDGMAGLDPARLHTDSFQRAKTIDKYTTRFLMKGTVLKGAIEVPASMTEEQFKEVRERLRDNFRGADAEDDVLILTDGAKLNNATMTSSDAQLVEQASHSTKQIAQLTDVHPYFLFDDKDGKYNASGESAGADLVKFTFRPWMELTDAELTAKLLTDKEQAQGFTIRLNADALMRGDSKTITGTLVQQTGAGLRTQNEAREVLELAPSPDPNADTLQIRGNAPLQDKSDIEDRQENSRTPSRRFSTVQDGQWEPLECCAMEMCSDGTETARTFSVNVHQGGAIGTAVAAQYFPPGSTIDSQTAAGTHSFNVGEHLPHAHPNLVIPALSQQTGSQLPGNPAKPSLAHIAAMAAGSRVMGMTPVITVRTPTVTQSPPAVDGYAALRPVIEATCERIETKTRKAFENSARKTGQDRTIWSNVFAEEQKTFLIEALTPINVSLEQLGAGKFDIEGIGEKYAGQIRRKAAGGDVPPLSEWLNRPTG